MEIIKGKFTGCPLKNCSRKDYAKNLGRGLAASTCLLIKRNGRNIQTSKVPMNRKLILFFLKEWRISLYSSSIFHLVLEIFRLLWYSNEITYDVKWFAQILTYCEMLYIFKIVIRYHFSNFAWGPNGRTLFKF